MSGILDPQDAKISLRALNLVNDPSPGNVVATSGVSGSIIQPYAGQIGKRLVVSSAQALDLSDTTIGTLFEGVYQYVQVLLGATAAPARGAACYWSDIDNAVVTTDQVATNAAKLAGFFLSAPTKGNYCYIQLAGKTSCLFKSTITKATPADGDLAVLDAATSPRVDVLADATAIVSPNLKLVVGVCLGAAVSNAISLVDVWHLRQMMGGGF